VTKDLREFKALAQEDWVKSDNTYPTDVFFICRTPYDLLFTPQAELCNSVAILHDQFLNDIESERFSPTRLTETS